MLTIDDIKKHLVSIENDCRGQIEELRIRMGAFSDAIRAINAQACKNENSEEAITIFQKWLFKAIKDSDQEARFWKIKSNWSVARIQEIKANTFAAIVHLTDVNQREREAEEQKKEKDQCSEPK